HISPVSSAPAQATAATQSRISASQVSAAALNRANGDGDGRTGAAALNDGDSAAQAAAQQVRSSRTVDVKA
ncbi:MAG: hypothetical protein QOG59_647, partial [Solirubrobacteraceae bacterium]|nr:hypothetical protein [Solirubrobacteraceae bacterium]